VHVALLLYATRQRSHDAPSQKPRAASVKQTHAPATHAPCPLHGGDPGHAVAQLAPA
jgi:hypothetical protein